MSEIEPSREIDPLRKERRSVIAGYVKYALFAARYFDFKEKASFSTGIIDEELFSSEHMFEVAAASIIVQLLDAYEEGRKIIILSPEIQSQMYFYQQIQAIIDEIELGFGVNDIDQEIVDQTEDALKRKNESDRLAINVAQKVLYNRGGIKSLPHETIRVVNIDNELSLTSELPEMSIPFYLHSLSIEDSVEWLIAIMEDIRLLHALIRNLRQNESSES
jgi:hypothetical protein